MDNKTLEQLYNAIINFIASSKHGLRSYGVPDDELRIAFPDYLIQFLHRHFFCAQYVTVPPFPLFHHDKIYGIPFHPTWENSMTLYCKNIPRCLSKEIPVFKMNFMSECKEYGLDKHLVIDLSEFFSYKI